MSNDKPDAHTVDPGQDDELTRKNNFRLELEHLLNKHSMESLSDTPDYMLADHLMECLEAHAKITHKREKWYGRAPVAMGTAEETEHNEGSDPTKIKLDTTVESSE